MAEAKKSQIIALRKLTTKTIMEGRIFRPTAKEEYLYRIAGQVTGIKTGDSDYGPWVAFTGNFTARRHDGVLFAGPRAFIPQPFQDMIEAAIKQQEADGLVASVQFGLDISVIQDDTASIGYQYKCVPVIEVESEAQSLLESTMEKTPLPKLPAPKKTEK